jgi:hypothetical protein
MDALHALLAPSVMAREHALPVVTGYTQLTAPANVLPAGQARFPRAIRRTVNLAAQE